ncbi:MAG: hypothetical protein PUE63_05045 [Lachnospiraceae bacterium]|nr:hypothetical protein [Lachnospiraceae bacterium]
MYSNFPPGTGSSPEAGCFLRRERAAAWAGRAGGGGNLQILEKIFFLIMRLKIIFLYDTVVSDEKVPGPARENQKVRQEGKYRSKQTGTVRKT